MLKQTTKNNKLHFENYPNEMKSFILKFFIISIYFRVDTPRFYDNINNLKDPSWSKDSK